jgi:hypothetical protein
LAQLDVLVLNHGINPKGGQSIDDVNRALEINDSAVGASCSATRTSAAAMFERSPWRSG